MEIITIIAIIIGPIAAVQVDRYLYKIRSNRNNRVSIFKTLMATRGNVLSYRHVEALNRIDLEFSGKKKYDEVISAWKLYFNNLVKDVSEYKDEELKRWNDENHDLLVDLLLEMGKSLGYKFDKALIKRNIYSPRGHWEIEQEQKLIRMSLIELLRGNSSLPMKIIQNENDETLKKQKELQNAMLEYYKNKNE